MIKVNTELSFLGSELLFELRNKARSLRDSVYLTGDFVVAEIDNCTMGPKRGIPGIYMLETTDDISIHHEPEEPGLITPETISELRKFSDEVVSDIDAILTLKVMRILRGNLRTEIRIDSFLDDYVDLIPFLNGKGYDSKRLESILKEYLSGIKIIYNLSDNKISVLENMTILYAYKIADITTINNMMVGPLLPTWCLSNEELRTSEVYIHVNDAFAIPTTYVATIDNDGMYMVNNKYS